MDDENVIQKMATSEQSLEKLMVYF